MNRSQIGLVASLLVVAMTIAVLVSVLAERKTVLAAEGSDLRTTESIVASASLQELRARSDEFDPGTRTFTAVDEATRAVAFVSGGWDDVPLHSGSPLGGLPGEALAGAARAPGSAVVEVSGRPYRIVGRLGVRADSLLADKVFVMAPDLFAEDRERLRIDGPHIAGRFSSAFPGRSFELADSGVNRRTNVDVVTPFLSAAGLMTAVLVTASASSYAVRQERRVGRLRFLVGVRRRRLLLWATLRMGLVTVGPAATALALGLVLSRALNVQPEPTPVVTLISLFAISYLFIGVWNGARRWT